MASTVSAPSAAAPAAPAAPAATAPTKAHYMPSAREVNDELRLYFNRFDKNFSGSLERSEATTLVRELGIHTSHVNEFLKQFGADDEDKISFEQFKSKLFDSVSAEMEAKSKAELLAAFKKFDTDGDGVIAGPEIDKLMDFLRIPAQAAKQFMASADRDSDNQITFEEFAAVVRPSRM
jgi:Ca2+-binding EF-hand superfamily protein